MSIQKIITKTIPAKVIAAAVIPLEKKDKPLEAFSKAWEWDQLCNHCVD